MVTRASGVDVYHGNTLPPGQDFVILKATEGTSYTDPTFGARLKALYGHGPHVGAYHFAHPEAHTAQAEVDHFASVVGASIPADVSLWLDLESGLGASLRLLHEAEGSTRRARVQAVRSGTLTLSSTALRTWKNEWLAAARRVWPNNRIGLYCNRSYWASVKPGAGDGLWIASPGTAGQTQISDPWVLHQYSETGGVDRDVFNGSVADLAAWAGAGGDDMPTPKELWDYPLPAPDYPDGEYRTGAYSAGTFLANANAKAAQARIKAQEAADRVAALDVKVSALAGALGDDEANILAAIKAAGSGQVDVPALAAALRGQLAPEIVAALGQALANG